MDEQATFTRLGEALMAAQPQVAWGRMMRHPALTWHGKVFAFLGHQGLGVKVGEGFDAATLGVHDPLPLAPFKTKPPLRGWIVVPSDQAATWPALAEAALHTMQQAGTATN